VPEEKVGERLGHATWILHLEKVGRARENKPFDVWEPLQQQPVGLTEARPEGIAVAPSTERTG
jgi:hypothetical protein